MRIGVFCSGGDAPGMNACVRAVVRSAFAAGHQVVGVRHGYQGLLDEDYYTAPDGAPLLGPRCVSGILQRGGAILRSSRSEEFRTRAGQKKAAQNLRRAGIEALIAIGGDGTMRGALALRKVWDQPIILCPGTIDNDLQGTDYTIGFQTAVQTAVEALDKLRDTAESHERLFLVEVMGRHSGYLGLYTALAGGAEIAFLPETPTRIRQTVKKLRELKARGKHSILCVVAEGEEAGGAVALQGKLAAADCPFETRAVILGHLQRGGAPAPADRLLGTRLGDFAVRAVLAGETCKMAGEIGGRLVLTPFEACIGGHKPLPAELVELLEAMST